jgi:iron complex outermembrane recepter protein
VHRRSDRNHRGRISPVPGRWRRTTYAGPYLAVDNRFHRREFTAEVRANSDFQGPPNFTLGALYESGNIRDHVTVAGNYAYPLPPLAHFPPVLQDGVTPIDIDTHSVFGQARWQIMEQLELAGGLRWTDEKRVESPFNLLAGEPTIVPTPQLHSRNYAPEISLNYKPADDVTLFGAWKRGFKSGSFSIATPAVTGVDNSFGDEKVHGGEVGLKSRLLDHQLAVNVAAYLYNFDGLQVGVISPPSNGVPVIQTVNAATARTYGPDFDAAYHPAGITGLGLTGALNWNHARYLQFNNAPCWGGQTIAAGCNQNFIPPDGPYTAQNLSGTPLIRAPQRQANLGFDYSLPVMGRYALVFSNSNEVSSTTTTRAPLPKSI